MQEITKKKVQKGTKETAKYQMLQKIAKTFEPKISTNTNGTKVP